MLPSLILIGLDNGAFLIPAATTGLATTTASGLGFLASPCPFVDCCCCCCGAWCWCLSMIFFLRMGSPIVTCIAVAWGTVFCSGIGDDPSLMLTESTAPPLARRTKATIG